MKWRIPLAAVSAVVFIWGSLPFFIGRIRGIGVITPVAVGALGFLAAVFAPQTVQLFAAVRDAGRGVRCGVYAVGAVIALILLLFLVVSVLMLGHSVRKAPEDTPVTVVVLGAQVRKSGPSKALRYRLDTAADYLRNSPDTICIVSGGKGANEPFPEAQGMADYLKAHGIEEGRILQESKSKTTQENIVNSKKLIAGDNASVGIITNDFHMFRALQIAHDNGLDEAQGIAAGSPPDMLVNNMVREFFAEIKFLLS